MIHNMVNPEVWQVWINAMGKLFLWIQQMPVQKREYGSDFSRTAALDGVDCTAPMISFRCNTSRNNNSLTNNLAMLFPFLSSYKNARLWIRWTESTLVSLTEIQILGSCIAHSPEILDWVSIILQPGCPLCHKKRALNTNEKVDIWQTGFWVSHLNLKWYFHPEELPTCYHWIRKYVAIILLLHIIIYHN